MELATMKAVVRQMRSRSDFQLGRVVEKIRILLGLVTARGARKQKTSGAFLRPAWLSSTQAQRRDRCVLAS